MAELTMEEFENKCMDIIEKIVCISPKQTRTQAIAVAEKMLETAKTKTNKKSVLDKSNIDLPKHVFYEDNLFIYLPLVNTNTIYYLNLDLYRYYIGRADQSVQETQLIKRSSHQVLVSEKVCTAYDLTEIKNKKLRRLMTRECIFLMCLGVVFSRLSFAKEGEKQYKDLWKSVKEKNPKLYHRMRYFSIAAFVSVPGKIGRVMMKIGYRFAHSLVNFN